MEHMCQHTTCDPCNLFSCEVLLGVCLNAPRTLCTCVGLKAETKHVGTCKCGASIPEVARIGYL